MTGLRGEAAIIGIAELPAERKQTRPPSFTLDQYASLAKMVIDDAGVEAGVVNGLVCHGLAESDMFAPATLSEYLGLPVEFRRARRPWRRHLGGHGVAGRRRGRTRTLRRGAGNRSRIHRATDLQPATRHRAPSWHGASSNKYGSPQAEFEIPYGNVGQNGPYAQIAQRYAALFGYDPTALAKIAVDQRTNACAHPGAVFHGKPLTVDEVLASPMIADPIHMLETVMRVQGGAGVLIANADIRRRARHRPVWINGFGEHIAFKTATYAEDLMTTPVSRAAERAFAMAGLTPAEMDMASLYDCYTITVLMTLEDAGFCGKGEGMAWVNQHDLTFAGDFPLNTAGGQLSFGQAGMAGGMHHVVDAARQVMGRAAAAQVADCNHAFVSGTGGIMSEQVALVLDGD